MIFDTPLTRRRPKGGGGTDNDTLDLEELRAELPDAEEAMDEIDEALREAEQVLEQPDSGCGCW